nr:IS30 family transposase [Piscirickettsia salmonis]
MSEEEKMLIHQRLSTHTSPDVISQELIREHNIQVSESTIYRYIYDDRERGGELYKNLPHSGKPYKKKVSRGDQTKIPNRVGIEQRPAIADEKTEFGHFEIDTVVGRDHQSYLLTLIDKANKMCCIRKMPNKQAKTVINTFMRKRRYLGRYFAHPMMQNRRAKRDDYKPSAVRVTQRYVP